MPPTRKGNVEGQVRNKKKYRVPIADHHHPGTPSWGLGPNKNYNIAGESLQGKIWQLEIHAAGLHFHIPIITSKSYSGTSPLYDSWGIQYGYAWWFMTFPYKGRTVNAFYAGGNAGQYIFVVPELDLTVTFTDENCNDRFPIYIARDDYMPNYTSYSRWNELF